MTIDIEGSFTYNRYFTDKNIGHKKHEGKKTYKRRLHKEKKERQIKNELYI